MNGVHGRLGCLPIDLGEQQLMVSVVFLQHEHIMGAMCSGPAPANTPQLIESNCTCNNRGETLEQKQEVVHETQSNKVNAIHDKLNTTATRQKLRDKYC